MCDIGYVDNVVVSKERIMKLGAYYHAKIAPLFGLHTIYLKI